MGSRQPPTPPSECPHCGAGPRMYRDRIIGHDVNACAQEQEILDVLERLSELPPTREPGDVEQWLDA